MSSYKQQFSEFPTLLFELTDMVPPKLHELPKNYSYGNSRHLYAKNIQKIVLLRYVFAIVYQFAN